VLKGSIAPSSFSMGVPRDSVASPQEARHQTYIISTVRRDTDPRHYSPSNSTRYPLGRGDRALCASLRARHAISVLATRLRRNRQGPLNAPKDRALLAMGFRPEP